MRTSMRAPFAALLAGAVLLASPVVAADRAEWPAYRGPRGNGVSSETDLLKTWPAEGPKVLWRVDLGDGYSGMSVAGDRLFTMYGRDGSELLVALDAGTGKEVWRVVVDTDREDNQGGGPRSTPAVDDGQVFALGARGKLVAVGARDGEVAWRHGLREEFGATVPRWGVSTSPLVEGGLLLVGAGGRSGESILALDKRTGEVRWTSYADKPGYSTPLPVTIGGVRQVLFFTGTSLVSLAPRLMTNVSGRVCSNAEEQASDRWRWTALVGMSGRGSR